MPNPICEISGKKYAVKHHLLAKSIYPEFRDDPNNHFYLTAWLHTMDPKMCPHGMHIDARRAFARWVRDNKPEQFAWWEENSRKPIDCGDTDD